MSRSMDDLEFEPLYSKVPLFQEKGGNIGVNIKLSPESHSHLFDEIPILFVNTK